MKLAGLLLIAMLVIGAAAPKIEPQKKAEFNEPEGFSIYKWGTPPEVITRDYSGVHPDRRSGEKQGPREKFFRAGHAVGNIDLAVKFMFFDGGLAAVEFSFDRNRFDDLRRVFLERYGRPTWANRDMFWSGKKSSVSLSAVGVGLVTTNEYLVYRDEREKEQTKERTKKAVKDL
jgi:hypothetical protein